MALLGIVVPPEVTSYLDQIEVPGKVPTEKKHITLCYFEEDGLTLEEKGRALEVAFSVAASSKALNLAVHTVNRFPTGEDGIPIIAEVDSVDLLNFRADLCFELDRAGVRYSKKFPNYRPHITLSYCAPEVFKSTPMPKTSIEPINWTCFDIAFWDGNGDDKTTSIPLSLPVKVGLYRALVRLAARSKKTL